MKTDPLYVSRARALLLSLQPEQPANLHAQKEQIVIVHLGEFGRFLLIAPRFARKDDVPLLRSCAFHSSSNLFAEPTVPVSTPLLFDGASTNHRKTTVQPTYPSTNCVTFVSLSDTHQFLIPCKV